MLNNLHISIIFTTFAADLESVLKQTTSPRNRLDPQSRFYKT